MDNNQDDIKNFVNRFKKYIKFIIINSAINYSKKLKLRRKREIELDDIDNLENKLTKSQLDYIKNHICKDLGEFKTSLKKLVNDANDIAIEFSLDNYIGSFNKIIYKEDK